MECSRLVATLGADGVTILGPEGRRFDGRSWTVLAVLLLMGCASEHAATETKPAKTEAEPGPSAPPAASPGFHATVAPVPPGPRCREQAAQDFLLREGQLAKVGATAAEREQILGARKQSIDYRTREYGRFPGFGSPADNPHPPSYYAEHTTFMGEPLVVHRKIVPALRCVEEALKRDCAQHPYRPRQVSGLRMKNTYADYEVSNHVYGIAIDIDSQDNPCCNCVGKWSEAPICKKKVDSVYERMKMPKCWVDTFERYGFHWLGHDELEDTMHFEFLGDPDKITE